ncbi:MAG TPA: Gfo/Idh/MocA family oxidoreductase [Microlunatus sp.]|nr:Gfo/Idh/MocA family oxidoreductase [Microlunatus sp.]
MTVAERTRWGIVSTGHIAGVFARDLALLSDEAELVGVSSRSLDKAQDFAATYGFTRAYGSTAELAADPDIDAVYVASVHNDHAASARVCLEAGKAVLVEKPLTVTSAEADELVALARGRGAFLMEAVWNRTNPLVRKAVELVGAGDIGAVRHLQATFGFAFDGDAGHRLLDPEQAGGAILDLGVYPVHAAELFLGEPDGLDGFGTIGETGVDTHAAALLTFGARDDRPAATASIACSLETDLPTRLEVFGAAGSVVLENFIKPEELRLVRGRDEDPEVLVTQLPGQGYTFEAQEVMRCVRTGALESPLVPWASTLATMRTLERWLSAVSASGSRAGA